MVEWEGAASRAARGLRALLHWLARTMSLACRMAFVASCSASLPTAGGSLGAGVWGVVLRAAKTACSRSHVSRWERAPLRKSGACISSGTCFDRSMRAAAAGGLTEAMGASGACAREAAVGGRGYGLRAVKHRGGVQRAQEKSKRRAAKHTAPDNWGAHVQS